MEGEFGEQKEDIFSDERTVTSQSLTIDTSCDRLDPVDILLRLPHGHWMTFLQDLVDGYEGFEGLDFIGEDRLDLEAGPERLRGLVIPGVDDTASDVLTFGRRLFNAGSFADVDGQVGLGFGHVDVPAGAVVVIIGVGHVGVGMRSGV